jgi:hypothetical protein
VPSPASGLEIAEALSGRIAAGQRVSPPVLLEVGDREPAGALADWDGQLYPFSIRRMVLAPEVLLEGRGDELARVIHEHYRDTRAAQGGDPDAVPSSRPWADLADSYRQANRHQADHLWAKLAVTDCRAVREERVESFAFAPTEVERLAVIEHGRWAADRFLDGWSYAPKRDNTAKHHPQLIPYRQLSGPMKDLDRFAVRLVPALLARSGLGVARMLIVGVSDAAEAVAPGALRPLVDRMLARLLARYPDRGLVIAATLNDGGSRLIARRALESADAALFLLCPQPISEMLALQPDDQARRSVLQLAARAERRIPLPDPGDVRRWLDARAEILVVLEPKGRGVDADVSDVAVGKRVRIDPATGLDWGFEY